MFEEPLSREDHGHIGLIAGLDNLEVAL
jgi:hypothetical protein